MAEVNVTNKGYLRVFFLNFRPKILSKKRLLYNCFPVNFIKFIRTVFLWNTCKRLEISINLKHFRFLNCLWHLLTFSHCLIIFTNIPLDETIDICVDMVYNKRKKIKGMIKLNASTSDALGIVFFFPFQWCLL